MTQVRSSLNLEFSLRRSLRPSPWTSVSWTSATFPRPKLRTKAVELREEVGRISTEAFLNSLIRITPLFLGVCIVACDGRMQSVSLTTQDYRFVPTLVRVTASSPLTLAVYNAGREVHDFDSPILQYAGATPSSEGTSNSDRPGFVLEPGKSVQLVMSPPPGTYLYTCRRKGHANMTGTLVVE